MHITYTKGMNHLYLKILIHTTLLNYSLHKNKSAYLEIITMLRFII